MMTTWKLPKRKKRGPVQSSWRIAGERDFWCGFTDPDPDGSGAVGQDSTLHITFDAFARFIPKGSGPPVRHPGGGLTDVRVNLRRGPFTWMQGAGWVQLEPRMAMRFRSIPLESIERVHNATWDTWSTVCAAEVDASDLGPGPVTIGVYLEGHPRLDRRDPKYGFDPALAGSYSTSVVVDGEAPDTTLYSTSPDGDVPYVVGIASDNHEVKHVLLAVRDDQTGLFLDAGHHWSPRTHNFEVPVDTQGVWNWQFPVRSARGGSGDYSIVAQAEDIAERDWTRTNKWKRGNLDPSPLEVDFAPRE